MEELKQFALSILGSIEGVQLVTIAGQPAAKILEFASENADDMIVMSTHGLTGLAHFVMGSVAEKVVRQAPCPVLTIKAFGKSLPELEPSMAATSNR